MKTPSLRIAIVLNTAWNIHNFRLGLIRALLQAGHTVVAIAPMDDFVDSVKETGCDFEPLHHLQRKGTNPFKDFRLMLELRRIYKKQKIDLALLYTIKPNIYGSFALRGTGAKGICTVTGLGYSFLSTGFVHKIVKWLYKRAFKNASTIAFQNRDDLKLFTELGLVPQEKTALIKGSGINTEFFVPLSKTQKLDKFIFLFVGRLLRDKGIHEFIEAATAIQQKHQNVEFWVVGGIDADNPSGIQRHEIEHIEQQGIIRYLGKASDVRVLMREADAVVLPSYREGLPRVMLESLAMAKPIITTNAPGCRETVIDSNNGYMVPMKDSKALEEAMNKMILHTPQERTTMGQKGRIMALKEFDEKAIVKRYFEEIDKIFGA